MWKTSTTAAAAAVEAGKEGQNIKENENTIVSVLYAPINEGCYYGNFLYITLEPLKI